MNDWAEQMLTLWRDFACTLWEFIEYDIALNPRQEARFKEILKDHGMESE